MRKLWTHFEYWPSWLLYIFALPIFIYGIVKTRKLTFFTAANPALPTGGFFGEDKTEINRCFSKKYFPTEFSVSVDDSLDEILSKISLLNISFPFFAKLKIGERGRGVAEIKDIDELIKYRHRYQNFYIQAKIINGEELGIFFIKKPWEKQGQITSIVTKKYPEIIGDGNSTITQLIAKDSRLRLYVKHLLPYIDNPNEILKNKEKKIIHKIGNHSKGTQFLDGNNIKTKELVSLINDVFKNTSGIYYGRLDVKLKFKNNRPIANSLKVIEFNGVMAEPAHIYGVKWLWNAVRAIYKHWFCLIKISQHNIEKGAKTAPLSTLYLQLKTNA